MIFDFLKGCSGLLVLVLAVILVVVVFVAASTQMSGM
jgi:hypothetical protein